MKKKSIFSVLTSAMIFAAIPLYPISAARAADINAEYRTPAEIKKYFEENPFELDSRNNFVVQPVFTTPYSIGSLDDASLQNGLNALNFVRFTAGLSDVGLNSGYNELAQAAAFANSINGTLTHYPAKPAGMTDDLYKKAAEGASSSNLSYRLPAKNLAHIITLGYMDDSDAGNISALGHRRWCLNPSMGETGFGSAGYYSAMYAFDNSADNAGITSVCWPARNMPLEYFRSSGNSSPAWSVSVGQRLSADDIKVTVTRKYDSRQWVFSSTSADGDFYVDNGYYGEPGCIIFRPDGISFESGDSFAVKISGTPEPIEYTVSFFSLDEVFAETGTLGLGDVNYDNRVNASDSSLALAEYSRLSTGRCGSFNSEQNRTADINFDGRIDASDASEMLVYYSYSSTTSSPLSMAEWLKG